jgi:hypothetical protein
MFRGPRLDSDQQRRSSGRGPAQAQRRVAARARPGAAGQPSSGRASKRAAQRGGERVAQQRVGAAQRGRRAHDAGRRERAGTRAR